MLHNLFPLLYSKSFEGDTLLSLFFQNDKKALVLNSQAPTEIQDLVKTGIFNANSKTCSFIRGSYIEKCNLLVAGLGVKSDSTPEGARQSGAVVFNKVNAEKVKSLGIDVDALVKGTGKEHAAVTLAAFLEGFYLASYTFDKYKSVQKPGHALKSITLISEKKNQAWIENVINKTLITVDCTFLTRDLSNEPSNIGTPVYYAQTLSKYAKQYGIKCTVMDEAQARKEKMTLFLSVGEGSSRESQVVILEYTPKSGGKKAKTVSLVGKGVTFDSGGISIKPSMRMEDMKHDMTGAATMAGSTFMAARLGSKNKLITILVFAENMPGNNATQPGNIITARNGKTVEIINTDAEGRLVLADALDLAQDYKPDVILDSATLTGACSVALGKLASALFSNDSKVADQILDASEQTEEHLWELPLWDEYYDDMKSQYADMMNSANDGNGGTIRGAIFLKQFIREGTKWAHVDLANRAYDQGFIPYHPRKGSSGIYVRTFAEFAMNYR